MCWNADISLNTFLFGIFALLFIFLANKYSKYKLQSFENPLVYLFLLEVISIQLIEFFLWRNLENKRMNKLLSKIASFITVIQPLTLKFIMKKYRYTTLLFYIIYLIIFFYKHINNPINFSTSVSKNGHLQWNWMNSMNKLFLFTILLFYIIPLFEISKYNIFLSLFVIVLIIISMVFYYKDGTFSTMWCFYANLFLLYLIIDILIIKPFIEYNGLC